MNPIPSYNSSMNWLKYLFPLGTTQLSLVPVPCKKSVGSLGNWTQPLGDVLDGKFHNRPGGEKSKPPSHSRRTLTLLKQYFQTFCDSLSLSQLWTFTEIEFGRRSGNRWYIFGDSHFHRSTSKTCYSSFSLVPPNDLNITKFTTRHQTTLDEECQKITALFHNPIGVFWPKPDHYVVPSDWYQIWYRSLLLLLQIRQELVTLVN